MEAYEYLEKIRQTNSVAVHIRRGDYLKLQNIYGNICTEEYYRNAITKMYQMIENPVFFFFSDDMEWAKQTFTFDKNFVFADGRGVWQDYHDMHLMSECKNMIMANSSFSWWAAFLNANVDKQIICPARWINHKNTPDVYDTWEPKIDDIIYLPYNGIFYQIRDVKYWDEAFGLKSHTYTLTLKVYKDDKYTIADNPTIPKDDPIWDIAPSAAPAQYQSPYYASEAPFSPADFSVY